jgi:GT2 family glycosyltransferase
MTETKPYIIIGMPLAPDRKVDIGAGLFCGAFANCKNAEFIGKGAHETAYGRNLIIFDALKKPQATHIFFLDADTVPPDNAIARLLALNCDIATGLYRIPYGNKLCWSASIEPDEKGESYSWLDLDKLPDKPFVTLTAAGGCLLVKMEVFRKIGWPWFEYVYKPDGERLGEDVYFANKCRKAGYEIWANPVIQCRHFQTRDNGQFLNQIVTNDPLLVLSQGTKLTDKSGVSA